MNLKLAGDNNTMQQESVTRSGSTTKRIFQGMSFEQAEENFKLM